MSQTPREILIVEDDAAIAAGLALNLKLEGFVPTVVPDGEAALARLAQSAPALVLLDISLPGKTGLEVLAELRPKDAHTPVIVLSARQDEYDKVAALRLGADDYVTKPFAVAELMARIDAVLRRAGAAGRAAATPGQAARTRSFGDVVLDLDTRRVTRAGEEVKLTHLEFELLCFLVQNAGKVFSREHLLRQVWDIRHSGSARTVDNFVAHLRTKLEQDQENPRHFVTVRGSGYRFDP